LDLEFHCAGHPLSASSVMPLFRLAALPTMRVLLASNLRRPGMGSGTPVVTGKSMVTRTLARTAKQESSASHGHEENSQPSPMAQATKQANVATAPVKEKSHGRVHELTFEPFEEIREPLNDVQKSLETNSSTARAPWFTAEAEDAINAQINVELTISHVYDSMWAYFDRDNVALRGLAAYFAHESAEERRHAQSLMSYLNRRGGRVHLSTIPEPVREFSHPDKGDALNVRTQRLLKRVPFY